MAPPLFELNASFNDFDNKAFLLSLQWEQVFNVSPISAPPLQNCFLPPCNKTGRKLRLSLRPRKKYLYSKVEAMVTILLHRSFITPIFDYCDIVMLAAKLSYCMLEDQLNRLHNKNN